MILKSSIIDDKHHRSMKRSGCRGTPMGVGYTHGCCLILGGFWDSRPVTWSQYRPRAFRKKFVPCTGSAPARFVYFCVQLHPWVYPYTHGCIPTPMGVMGVPHTWMSQLYGCCVPLHASSLPRSSAGSLTGQPALLGHRAVVSEW